MTEHELLIQHAQRWAQTKQRPLHADLLQTTLSLHTDHAQLAPNFWPAHSVEHLLLDLWPEHGPERLPDPDELLMTLDTFWRFLRATGRLSHGSAQPAELVKIARRALPHMADPAPKDQGVGTVLADFGRTIGVDLDGAESFEQFQARFDQVVTAWNELTDVERLSRLPAPPGSGPEPAGSRLPRPDRAAATRQAREAPFTQACLALARWVGDGQPVTATGVLRLAAAEEAYAALALRDWLLGYDATRDEYQQTYAAYPLPLLDRADVPSPQKWPWRSAGDCLPLDRLWWSAEAARFVEIGKTKARATGRPRADEDWLAVGLGLVLGLCQRWPASEGWNFLGLLYVMALTPQRWAPIDMLRDWWDSHLGSPRAPHRPGMSPRELQLLSQTLVLIKQSHLDRLLAGFADTGLWERRGAPGRPQDDEFRLTDFGVEFATIFGAALEGGWLPDDDLDDDDLDDDNDDDGPFRW